jgi:hypothetical protein
MPKEVFNKLSENLRGSVITPENSEYEVARKVYNGMIDRRPDAIVRCADVADARHWLFVMPQDWTWWVWLVTACLLLIGLMGMPEAFLVALLLSIAQFVLFFARERAFKAFPVQLRLAYMLLLIICFFLRSVGSFGCPLSAPSRLSYSDTV